MIELKVREEEVSVITINDNNIFVLRATINHTRLYLGSCFIFSYKFLVEPLFQTHFCAMAYYFCP